MDISEEVRGILGGTASRIPAFSTAVDLSQLRDQIFAQNDEGPGGFDQFRADFHCLHTEILATRVPDAIPPRELNGIVRDGIDPNATWEQTFKALAGLLTLYRQKAMDPYGENKLGLLIGHQSVAANVVGANAADRRLNHQKRSAPPRDQGGRYQKSQRTTTIETPRVKANSSGPRRRPQRGAMP